MSEESNTHSGSPSGSTSSTLDDASPSPSRQSTFERDSIRKVSFPEEETDLVTGYLEPPNPWQYAHNATREDLISHYKSSCLRHGCEPLPRVLQQLKEVDLGAESIQTADEGKSELGARGRSEILDLKGEPLGHHHCEPLEEILKRLQFQIINLEDTFLDDEASVALFDMVEYYEAAKQLNISSNNSIGPRGWLACSQMLKKTRCLEKLVARNTKLSEQLMPALCRGLRIGTHLQILHLENCSLSGRSIALLVNALKTNTALKELHLADNGLGVADALHLGALLRVNSTLQLLDISNNNFHDAGVGHICDALVVQAEKDSQDAHYSNLVKGLSEVSSINNALHQGSTGGGLSVLILWNNQLTKKCAVHLFQLLANSKSLDTLNVGQNMLTSESIIVMKEALQQTRSLERLGLQSTRISCEGAIALAECIAVNPHLQRIDLRDNQLQIGGLMALSLSMKVNFGVTRLDLDDNPKRMLDGGDETLKQYHNLVLEIRSYCTRNLRETEQKVIKSVKSSNVKDAEPGEEGVKPMDATLSPVHNTTSISRKISLTCETLLRSSAVNVLGNDGNSQRLGHHLTPEPRRGLGVGARLRSPAPSPVPSPSPSPTPSPTPSPHSSPVPSPSRSRFHVSRVTESTSTNSSEGTFFLSTPTLASSPIPSPSTALSIPSPGVSSRFKVTLVSEPNFTPTTPNSMPQGNMSTNQTTPTVVTSSTSNVTIGFKFPVEKEDEDTSVLKESVESIAKESSEPNTEEDDGWNFDEPSEKELEVKSPLSEEPVSEENTLNEPGPEMKNCIGAITDDEKVKSPSESETMPSSNSITTCPDIVADTSHLPPSPQVSLSSDLSAKSPYSVPGRIRKFSNVIPPHNVEPEPPPRIQSSIEKLLGIFQHPGSFFGKSSNSGSQNQSSGSQPSVGVGYFFGAPSGLSITRPSKPSSTETQQLRKTSSSKSPPSSFSSMILSNVMQEVSAMRSVFPGSQSCPDKSIFSLNSQCSGKSSCSENKVDPDASDCTTSSFPNLEDNRVHSDLCSNLRPKNSQLSDDFHESTVSVSRPNDVELPVESPSYDNPNCTVSLSESVPSLLQATKNESRDRIASENVDVECERTIVSCGVLQDAQLCTVESCSSAEEQLRDSSLGKTGFSTEECIIDKDSVIPLLSPAVSEEVSTAELVDTSCDFSDPNSDTCSDEIENVQAVKDVEMEEKKTWCKENEVILDREGLSQNLQLDILATCYAEDEEKKLGKGDEIGCATVGVGMGCDTSETIADIGSASAANILGHLGGQQE